jgi:hypothetical protein
MQTTTIWKISKKIIFEKQNKKHTMIKIYKKLFNVKWKLIWIAYCIKYSRNFYLTLTNDIIIKKLKLHKKLTKFESNLTTQIHTNWIKLIDYLFNKKIVKHCLVNIFLRLN